MSDFIWRQVAFKEICTSLLNGGTPSTNTNKYWNGNIPWVTGADFGNQALSQVRRHITPAAVKQSATKIVKAGSILLVTRTGVGKIAIAPFDVAFSQDITGITFGDNVEVRFMYYCLQAHMEELKKLNQGTSINGILKEDFLAYQINLPPLPHQQKIAKILTTVDNLIEKTEALIAKYQSIKQGMMHDLFNRGVDANGKLRPPRSEAPELYKQSELGWIPKEWESIISNVYCSSINSGSTPKDIFQHALNSIPFLRVQNLSFDGSLLIEKDLVFTSRKTHETLLIRSQVFPMDILMNIVGPPMGKISLVPEDFKEWNINQAIVYFRVKGKEKTKYFLNFMLSEKVFKWFLSRAKRTTGQQNLNVQMCRSLPIVQPFAEFEQKKITLIFDSINSDIIKEQQNLKKILSIKIALMHDLLTGKVQVTADEVDLEPAHE